MKLLRDEIDFDIALFGILLTYLEYFCLGATNAPPDPRWLVRKRLENLRIARERLGAS
jgi:hypothetical protein